MNRRKGLIERVLAGYREAFGTAQTPPRLFAAPGRVNLIGEHVDYNDGFVLPCAIDRETIVVLGGAPQGSRAIEALALDMGEQRDRFSLDAPITHSQTNWHNMLRGVVFALQRRGHTPAPARLAIAGDVPIGAGLSSSASFGVAITLALSQHAGLALSPEQIALIAQEAENDFLGTQCGIMDQMASAASVAGHALRLDCRSLESRHVPVAERLAVVIIDSGVRRELAESGFNARRAQCEAAAAALGVRALRDVTPAALEAARDRLDPLAFRRARHVVSEIARVEPFTAALARGDTEAIAQLMRASHASLREDFEVTVPAVDRLAAIVDAALCDGPAALGGVRMTGAGFGGCLVAVVDRSATARVLDAVGAVEVAAGETPPGAAVYAMAGGAGGVVAA